MVMNIVKFMNMEREGERGRMGVWKLQGGKDEQHLMK